MERRGFLAALAAAATGVGAWLAAPWKAAADPYDPHPGVPVGALGQGDFHIVDVEVPQHPLYPRPEGAEPKTMSMLRHPCGEEIPLERVLDEQEKAWVLEQCQPAQAMFNASQALKALQADIPPHMLGG